MKCRIIHESSGRIRVRAVQYGMSLDPVSYTHLDVYKRQARTPLIISGQSGKSTKLYEACDVLAGQLERGEASAEFSKINAILGEEIEETGDYIYDEKEKNVSLTEEGVKLSLIHILSYFSAN